MAANEPAEGSPSPAGQGERAGAVGAVRLLARPRREAALPSHARGHLLGGLRLALETTCSPLLSGQCFKCGTFWNVLSAFEACF